MCTQLSLISIKVVLKGGLGVLTQIFFAEIGTKLGNSRHFECHLQLLPQQVGRWHLLVCNMHIHVGRQFIYWYL